VGSSPTQFISYCEGITALERLRRRRRSQVVRWSGRSNERESLDQFDQTQEKELIEAAISDVI
jgi:hypothetical protein